jgi:hypothetical protein
VDRTNITGEIVVHEFAAKSLTYISISENYNHTGSIPEAFGHLENLIYLYLYNNNLSDEIQASIGRLPLLYMLDLSNNGFNGMLPPSLFTRLIIRLFQLVFSAKTVFFSHSKSAIVFQPAYQLRLLALC